MEHLDDVQLLLASTQVEMLPIEINSIQFNSIAQRLFQKGNFSKLTSTDGRANALPMHKHIKIGI